MMWANRSHVRDDSRSTHQCQHLANSKRFYSLNFEPKTHEELLCKAAWTFKSTTAHPPYFTFENELQ